MQIGFSFDVTRCSGCMACVVACQDENDLPENGPSFRHVTRVERGDYPTVNMSFLSLACLHCGDAPCLMVCPTGAIYKRGEDGIVGVHQDLCVGCHSCALACPFGAPQYPDGGKMSKCHFCADRVDHGMEPACVRVCPTRALGFGSMDNLSRQKAEKASRLVLEPLLKMAGY
jgi:DMSO reductase iron-sulfur subunit